MRNAEIFGLLVITGRSNPSWEEHGINLSYFFVGIFDRRRTLKSLFGKKIFLFIQCSPRRCIPFKAREFCAVEKQRRAVKLWVTSCNPVTSIFFSVHFSLINEFVGRSFSLSPLYDQKKKKNTRLRNVRAVEVAQLVLQQRLISTCIMGKNVSNLIQYHVMRALIFARALMRALIFARMIITMSKNYPPNGWFFVGFRGWIDCTDRGDTASRVKGLLLFHKYALLLGWIAIQNSLRCTWFFCLHLIGLAFLVWRA